MCIIIPFGKIPSLIREKKSALLCWLNIVFRAKGLESVMKKDWSNHRLIVVLPLLFVVMIYATEALVRSSFLLCNTGACSESIPEHIWDVLKIDSTVDTSPSTSVRENNDQQKITALKYSGRMTWYFLGEIFLFVSIGSIAVASVLTFQLFPKNQVLWMFGATIFSFLVGIFLYFNPKYHMLIFLTLFEKTIATDVPAITRTTNFLNSFGNVAIFSLLLNICSTLIPSQSEPFAEGMKELYKRMKYLRLNLYTGTFLLVTAILLKKSVYQWSLAYISQDEAIIGVARDFVSSLLTLEGGFYTLVVAAGYFPAVFVLQRRAQLLFDESVDEVEKEKKLQEFGITFSFKESLPRILAILGPLLTGPIGDLLTGNFF
jgi:hypothetical protein